MNFTENQILQVLAKKNGTTISAAEQSEVQKWASLSSENSALVDSLDFIEDNAELLKSYKSYSVPHAGGANGRKLIILFSVLAVLTAILIYFFMGLSPKSIDRQVAFLSDDSEIQLLGQSSFTLSEEFNSQNRLLELEGSAFFDISHNEVLPFTIMHDGAKIQVLGTSFYVVKTDTYTELQVIDGLVSVTNNQGKNILVRAREQVQFNDSRLEKVEFSSLPMAIFEANYRDVDLQVVLDDVEKFFDFPIILESTSTLENCTYNGDFHSSSVKEIMEELSIIFKMKYSLQADKLVIHSTSCSQ